MLGFFQPCLYIRLSSTCLTVRDPRAKLEVSEVPEIALASVPRRSVMAVGAAARASMGSPGVTVTNPFAHPRSLLSDFTLADLVLKGFISKVWRRAMFKPFPVMVLHPLGAFDGGLTQIEIRAMRELARGAGASQVVFWLGPELTDEEVISRNFPSTGKLVVE